VADVDFFLAPLAVGVGLARVDDTDGAGEPLMELGVPRSLPVSILRFLGGGFFISEGPLRFAIEDFGAGRFFSVVGLIASVTDCISVASDSFSCPPRILVPYSFCASAIALRVSVSREAAVVVWGGLSTTVLFSSSA